jgi:hypothetical protein
MAVVTKLLDALDGWNSKLFGFSALAHALNVETHELIHSPKKWECSLKHVMFVAAAAPVVDGSQAKRDGQVLAMMQSGRGGVSNY